MIKKEAYLNTGQLQQDYRRMLPITKLEFAIGTALVVGMLCWFVWLATNPNYVIGRITETQQVAGNMMVAEASGPLGSDYLLADDYVLEPLMHEWVLADGERTQGQPPLLKPDNLAYPSVFNHVAHALIKHHMLVEQYTPFALMIIGALLLLAGRTVLTLIYVSALSAAVLFIGWHMLVVAEWAGYVRLDSRGMAAALLVLGVLVGHWSLINLRLQVGNSLVAGLLWIIFSDVWLLAFGLEGSRLALLLVFATVLFVPQVMIAIIAGYAFSSALDANVAASYALLGLCLLFVVPRILEDGSFTALRNTVMPVRKRVSNHRGDQKGKISLAEFLDR